MKLLFAIFSLCCLTIPSFLFAQFKEDELLDWDSSTRLSWADYKASPTPESDAAASTTTYLSIEYKITNKSFGYKIQSRFSKNRSWCVHKTPYILSHEQGHFDIAEVFARKLHKEMSEYTFNKKTFKKDLRKIYEKVTDEKEKIQNEYDEETNHSINKRKQREWLIKIEEMLEEYSDYADY